MVGALISAGIAASSAIAGGVMSGRATRAKKKALKQEKKENQDWFNRKYYEDATQRADAQRLLQRTQEVIRNRNKQAEGTQAVVGGSEESVAATKEANSKALADAVGQISANAQSQKDAVEANYITEKNRINSGLAEMETQRANNITNAVTNTLGAVGQVGGAIDDYVSSRSQTAKTASESDGNIGLLPQVNATETNPAYIEGKNQSYNPDWYQQPKL